MNLPSASFTILFALLRRHGALSLIQVPWPLCHFREAVDLSLLSVVLNRIDIRQGVSDHCSGSEDFKLRLCERIEVLIPEATVTKLDLSNLEPARGELETIRTGPLLHYMGIDPSLITHLSLANNDLNGASVASRCTIDQRQS